MKRVICLVPSLTETLIEANINVVGRTRYCIHPSEKVAGIEIVGGTKDVRWPLVEKLGADLLILDQEENPKRFAEQSPIPYFATHITSIHNVSAELEKLADLLDSKELFAIAKRWAAVSLNCVSQEQPTDLSLSDCKFIPGVIEWWSMPTQPITQVVYLIWRKPWMAVSSSTFIGSVLNALGMGLLMPKWTTLSSSAPGAVVPKYPKIELEEFLAPGTLLLFSSEPYDFKKDREELIKLPVASALVDGEKFSWFGLRSLQFLENKNKF